MTGNRAFSLRSQQKGNGRGRGSSSGGRGSNRGRGSSHGRGSSVGETAPARSLSSPDTPTGPLGHGQAYHVPASGLGQVDNEQVDQEAPFDPSSGPDPPPSHQPQMSAPPPSRPEGNPSSSAPQPRVRKHLSRNEVSK